MSLLAELKQEHASLVHTLNVICDNQVSRDVSLSILFKTKDLLLSHLKHEDDAFYPLLKAAAKKDKELLKILDDFSEDMAKISTKAMHFFDNYSTDNTAPSFARDSTKLCSYIKQRIVREEKILFKIFDQLEKKAV